MSFPIGLSNGPPPGGKAPNGRNGLAEVAAAGVTFIRTGRADWSPRQIGAQVAAERALLDAAHAHGLQGWLWLGDLPNLPAGTTSPQAKLLASVADGMQGHAALGAYKGIDEPQPISRRELDPPGGPRARLRAAAPDRSHASRRDHAGADRDGRAAAPVPARVRHHRCGRLPDLVSTGNTYTDEEQGHQRRR